MELLFFIFPLAGIFVLNLFRRAAAAKFASWLLGIICVLQAAMAATSALDFWKPVDDALRTRFPLSLSIDFISAIVLFTIALVAAAANAVTNPGSAAPRKVNGCSLILMLMIGMNGVVMVRDLFSLYVFLEITSVSAFILIAMFKDIPALEGAFKYLILSGLASFAILIASALVFMSTGSLRFEDAALALHRHNTAVEIALVLYVVAFCVKAGAAPFHGWVPDAYANAPDAVSVLLGGVITKVAGTYGIIRLTTSVFTGLNAPAQAFMVLGAFSIVLGAFAAMGQTDMKRMLAFSSISQVGYVILAAGLGTKLAVAGALLHFFNHALFKSLLFVDAAAVKEQCGTTDMDKLGGISERMPVTGWTSVVGFLSTAGIPPLSGFWSKLLIIMALVMAGHWFYAGLATLMSLVTLVYFLIMQHKVFFGILREGFGELREARASLTGTAITLAALTAVVGVLFPFVLVLLRNYGLI